MHAAQGRLLAGLSSREPIGQLTKQFTQPQWTRERETLGGSRVGSAQVSPVGSPGTTL